MAKTGTQFYNEIKSLLYQQREDAIIRAVLDNNVPDWIRLISWIPITVTKKLKDQKTHKITYYVTPDVFSIGTDTDFLRIPSYPATAQWIANHYDAILPSRLIVDQIWSAADGKIPPRPMTPNGLSSQYLDSNNLINLELQKIYKSPTNNLISGSKKNIVIGPEADTSHVIIYGWYFPNGVKIQPYSPYAHSDNYVDYSHGITLVFRNVTVDGTKRDIVDVFHDPLLSELVSDQGPFNPFYPGKAPAVPPSTTKPPPPSVPVSPVVNNGHNKTAPGNGITSGQRTMISRDMVSGPKTTAILFFGGLIAEILLQHMSNSR